MEQLLDDMLACARRHATTTPTPSAVPGLAVYTAAGPSGLMPGVYEPMLCLVLQGAKEVMIGDQALRYDPHGYFIASLEVPVSGRIVEASRDKPYVAMSLRLSREGLATLITDAPHLSATDAVPQQGFGVSPLVPELLEPCRRLLGLLDAPHDIAVMAPLLEREILYRLLQGPHGAILRQIVRADSRISRIRRAVGWIQTNFDRPLRIESLAELAGMSLASFHRHFKAATAMSPLQFQKALRLQHARRLLITDTDVARAGYAVGYESASQFSREYARAFGAPPARDAVRLRGDGASLADAAA